MQTPMAALKAATAHKHDALEAIAHSKQIMDKTLTLPSFQQLMVNQYRLHYLLEPALRLTLDQHAPELAYGQLRCKLDVLEQDLRDLGLPAAVLLDDLPLVHEISDLPSALGTAYVLEGSSLGGNVIRRALLQQPDIAAQCRFYYYGFYGEDLRQRWLDFTAFVNQALVTPDSEAAACQAACDTFDLAARVFRMPLAVPTLN
ncbi:MAG: biliverdin-producing heme oxygenase [Candidatus Sericytochromatia bacterium]|nr:biliverdin-producing heme oxygenase [Candidatus Sericytochromatia bacterium]